MKIYTRKGDQGQTRLADGTAHGKKEDIFEIIGAIDELNSWIGHCNSFIVGEDLSTLPGLPAFGWVGRVTNPPLRRIQNNLFTINAILAKAKNIKFDVEKETKFLEREIDKMEKELPPLKNFILPGGNDFSSALHITRTVCRRTERALVRCQHVNTMTHKFIPYFNRLSDYFFILARWVNYKNEIKETIWKA